MSWWYQTGETDFTRGPLLQQGQLVRSGSGDTRSAAAETGAKSSGRGSADALMRKPVEP
jgi:hypothetical protein